MKKMQTVQKNHKKPRVIALILLIIVLILGGVLLLKQYEKKQAIATERAQYAQAERDLNSLAIEIAKKFGKPDSTAKNNSCGYTSQEFGRGIRYCNTDQYLFYPSSSLDAANALANKIGFEGLRGGTIKSQYNSGLSKNTPPIDFFTESFTLASLNCFADYSYHLATEDFVKTGYANLKPQSNGQGLLVNLGCSAKFPKAEYYLLDRDYL